MHDSLKQVSTPITLFISVTCHDLFEVTIAVCHTTLIFTCSIMAEVRDDGDHSLSSEEEGYELETEEENENEEGFVEGMDRGGFVGDKSLKPLTPGALATFRAAQDRAGLIYISRIPPGMQPAKVRYLMSAYGEVGRVYLQQEGTLPKLRFCCSLIFSPRC